MTVEQVEEARELLNKIDAMERHEKLFQHKDPSYIEVEVCAIDEVEKKKWMKMNENFFHEEAERLKKEFAEM